MTAVSPDNVASKSSKNEMLAAESNRLALVILNLKVAIPPGGVGSSMKSFLKTTGSAVDVILATANPELDGLPLKADSTVVSLLKVPTFSGTTSTVAVQISPANKKPPRSVIEFVPLSTV